MPESPACSSSGAQMIATFKQEATRGKKQSGSQVPSNSRTRGPSRPRRRVGRIMRPGLLPLDQWIPTGIDKNDIAKSANAMCQYAPRVQRKFFVIIPLSSIYEKTSAGGMNTSLSKILQPKSPVTK